ncbi:MAG: hypothetical protein SNJ71_07110, partial [Bacteroidales bacterium]
REEHQTEDGEALRHDDTFAYVAAWQYNNEKEPILHKEPLKYEYIQLNQRNYK